MINSDGNWPAALPGSWCLSPKRNNAFRKHVGVLAPVEPYQPYQLEEASACGPRVMEG